MALKPCSASAAVEVNTAIVWLLPIAIVTTATSLSKATIYRSIKSGTFPAPVKISARRVGWRSSDIAKFVAGDWEDGVSRG